MSLNETFNLEIYLIIFMHILKILNIKIGNAVMAAILRL